MKTLLYAFLIFTPFFGFSQITVTGLPPARIPTSTTAKMHYDSTAKIMYLYRFPKWYYQGVIVRASVPNDVTTSGITISYQDFGCRWYNTTTQSYWDWTGNSFLNTKSLNLDSLLTANNTWTGKNTFKDSVTAEKGLISGGLIDTKGLTSTGSSTRSATTVNGVQKGKRRLITSNTTLDGNDFFLEISCTSSDIEIITPPLSSETEGWSFDIKRTDGTAYIVKFKRPDNSYIRILNKRSATLRSNGTNWNFD